MRPASESTVRQEPQALQRPVEPVLSPGKVFAEMMKRVLAGILLCALPAGIFLAGFWYGHGAPGGRPEEKRKILYYVDPMNPAHTSDEPCLAPCGMPMEPVYEDGGRAAGGGGGNTASSPGSVRIDAEKRQIVGIRTEAVEKAPFHYTIRTSGRVVPNEDRVYRISTVTDGIVRNLYRSSTGTLVMKDERLASFYSREFLSAQQAYFYALRTFERLKPTEDEPDPDQPEQEFSLTNSQLESAIENLETLGMGRRQIEELAESRQYTREIYVQAPATGLVLQRNISPGQRFEKNTEFFRLADLSSVWVLADLFEQEAGVIKPGLMARVRLPHQGKSFEAMVSDVPPLFDPASRTLKLRLEVENPSYDLRPDMFVDVEFVAAMPEAVSVPVDAVIDSGLHRIVYMDLGDGYFEPRQVETGWRKGQRIEVVHGLSPGDRIVVTGNFLIDSESRMKLARSSLARGTGKCPSCGMEVLEAKAKAENRLVELKGMKLYFCSDECMKQFGVGGDTAGKPSGDQSGKGMQMAVHRHEEKNDEPGKGESPPPAHSESAHKPAGNGAESFDRCPVCSSLVRVSKAAAAGRTVEMEGKVQHFCSDFCMKRFRENPERYGAKKDGKDGR